MPKAQASAAPAAMRPALPPSNSAAPWSRPDDPEHEAGPDEAEQDAEAGALDDAVPAPAIPDQDEEQPPQAAEQGGLGEAGEARRQRRPHGEELDRRQAQLPEDPDRALQGEHHRQDANGETEGQAGDDIHGSGLSANRDGVSLAQAV